MIACITMLFSCKKETIKDETPIFAKKSSSHSDENFVPFKGYYITRAEFLQGPAKQKITGTGEASHLGASTFVANATVNFGTPPPFAIEGTAVFTAANGDQFFTRFTGWNTPLGNGMSRGDIFHTLTGGTGRFDDATGTLTAVALVNQASPTNQVWYEGSINY